MLTPQQLHSYQRSAILHQLHCPDSMLWLDPGLGKTCITLTTIAHRMSLGQLQKTLVLGPVKVIQSVWKKEALKWSHLQHLRFTTLHGSKAARTERLHVNGSDIYLMNYENLNWLAAELKRVYLDNNLPIPFQMIVYDEVTRMKTSTSIRVSGSKKGEIKMTRKAGTFTLQQFLDAGWDVPQLVEQGYCRIKKAVHKIGWRDFLDLFTHRTGLTGTPAANGYEDLFGQYLVVDGGKRLGQFVTHYRDAYFQSDYMGWSRKVTDLGKVAIDRRIADITITMNAEDYLQMPDLQFRDHWIDLPPGKLAQYKEIEADMFTRLDCGTEIEVFNQASVSNKCLQFASGAVIIEPGKPEWAHVHDEKLEALDSLIEEAGRQPVLLGYWFRADAERIMKRYKQINPVNITDLKSAKQLNSFLEKWGRGDVPLALGQPQSVGHGVDGLQDSGSMLIWFGLPWSYELYDQMIRRLYRQGGQKKVIVHRILARETLDMAVAEALRNKETTQDGLKRAINRYRQGLVAES